MKSSDRPASEILTQARCLIESVGFCKFRLAVDTAGRILYPPLDVRKADTAAGYCERGAIIQAVGRIEGRSTFFQMEAVEEYMIRALPDSYTKVRDSESAVDYNNRKATTRANVLAWFDRAIALAKADEGE
jgi:hypothetical protein